MGVEEFVVWNQPSKLRSIIRYELMRTFAHLPCGGRLQTMPVGNLQHHVICE
jgi:hypothetical protein